MANHKSAIKRIRSNERKRLYNRYYARTLRNAIKEFRLMTDKKKAGEKLLGIVSIIDRMSKRKIIHKNKAANLKSKLTRKVNSL